MTCQACSSENPDGAVFCNNCGERMVVGVPDGFQDDRPFFAYQWMGATHLFSFFGWARKYLAAQLIVIVSVAVIAIGVGPSGWLAFVTAVVGGLMYFLLWYVLIMRYRARGSPTDFGGGGPPVRP